MRKLLHLLMSLTFISFIALPSDTFAQPAQVKDKAEQTHKGPRYNPATVQTVSGEVIKIKKKSHRHGRGEVMLKLITDKEEVYVRLGPKWFLKNENFKIKKHDQIVVTGSRIDRHGKPMIIAIEVKKGDKTLKLRDANGFPLWRDQDRWQDRDRDRD